MRVVITKPCRIAPAGRAAGIDWQPGDITEDAEVARVAMANGWAEPAPPDPEPAAAVDAADADRPA